MTQGSEPRFNYRILLIDDDHGVRTTGAMVLRGAGHEVHTAEHGFQGLTALSRSLPDLIISDLKMPGMSGFEFLSVVRRRFPHIPVIAISGEYNGGPRPPGVLADAFFSKGHYSPRELLDRILELISEFPIRTHLVKSNLAPVWYPRSESGYYILTCTDCLRSFSVAEDPALGSDIRTASCIFCDSQVRYIVERPFQQRSPHEQPLPKRKG
jgi:CheY-like chemotaxis protein